MAGRAEISWPHLRMRIVDNASFAHGFRILRYTGIPPDMVFMSLVNNQIKMIYLLLFLFCF